MFRRKSKAQGPQTNMNKAAYQLHQRRVKFWMPYVLARIEELQARIRDKRLPAGRDEG